MFFTWCSMPPPQLWEQVPSLVQAVTTQSTAQGSVLHGVSRTRSLGQAAPPAADATLTSRISRWVPPPQTFVHSPVTIHFETSQSTGQSPLLHSSSSKWGPSQFS